MLSETNDKKLKLFTACAFLNGNDLNKCYDKFNNIMEQLIKENTSKSNDSNSNTDNKVYHASLKLKKTFKANINCLFLLYKSILINIFNVMFTFSI